MSEQEKRFILKGATHFQTEGTGCAISWGSYGGSRRCRSSEGPAAIREAPRVSRGVRENRQHLDRCAAGECRAFAALRVDERT